VSRSFLAILAAVAVAFGVCDANAGIRTSLYDGDTNTTTWFYSASDNFLQGVATLGGSSIELETILTNYPGNPITDIGTMQQQLQVISQSTNSVPGNLTLTSWVVDDSTLATVSQLATGVTNAGQIALLAAAGEKYFSYPAAPSYNVKSTADGLGTTGTSQTTTFVNTGVPVTTGLHNLLPPSSSKVATGTATAELGNKYRLSQSLTVTGATTGYTASGQSEVTAGSGGDTVPEPATLAIWSLGLGIAGLVRLRRKQ